MDSGLIRLAEADVLVGHNIIGYDLPLLQRLEEWGPSSTTRVVDTAVLSRLLRSDRRIPRGCTGKGGPHSLNAWGHRLGRGKPEHEDWSQYSPEMLHRCSEDTEINVLVYKALIQEEAESALDWSQAKELEHELARIITQQEINGVPFDKEKAEALRGDLKVGILDVDEKLVPNIPPVPLSKSRQPKWPEKQFRKDGNPTVQALKYYGEGHSSYRTDIIVKTEPINLGSDKQVKDYLLTIGWVPTEWNYKKDPATKKPLRDMRGNKIRTSPKLTEDSFDSLALDIGKEIALRLKMAHRLSLVEGLIDRVRPDGRLTAAAIPMGTPTARMTHSGVVNIPGGEAYLGHELRDLFGTVEGYTRVGIDLANCQLRALCHYMEDKEYQRAVLEGTKENDDDSHCLARDLAGLDTRQQGKKFTYSTLFGAGEDKLASDLGISVTEAKIAKETFFTNLPKLASLIADLKKQWKAMGCLIGLDGRGIWVRSEHMLLVYLLQSLEAIVMKIFIAKMISEIRSRGLMAQLVTTMHDEVQFLVEDKDVDEFSRAAHCAIDEINIEFNLTCPQAIDIQTGNTWADCH